MKFKDVNCNVCGNNNTVFLGKRQSPDKNPGLETNIVQCRICGLVYPNPMPNLSDQDLNANFDDPAGYFEQDVNKRLKFFEQTLDFIERYTNKRGRLLDVGCARGELLYAAEKRGWNAVGTDVSTAFIEYGKEKFGVKGTAGDITDMDMPEDSFDAVCLVSVIQYLQDPVKTLKKINRLLKKTGILYLECTNEDALIFKTADFFKSCLNKKKVTTHLSPLFPSYQSYGFSRKTLETALKKAGFHIIYLKVSGVSGGGICKGKGIVSKTVNFCRKLIVAAGGVTGRGHLIFCIAGKDC